MFIIVSERKSENIASLAMASRSNLPDSMWRQSLTTSPHKVRRRVRRQEPHASRRKLQGASAGNVSAVVLASIFLLCFAYCVYRERNKGPRQTREQLQAQRRRQRRLQRRALLVRNGLISSVYSNPTRQSQEQEDYRDPVKAEAFRKVLLKNFESNRVIMKIDESHFVRDMASQSKELDMGIESVGQSTSNGDDSKIVRLYRPSPGQAKKIPTTLGSNCPICLETFESGDILLVSSNPDCPHGFHQDCITDYLVLHHLEHEDDDTTPCPCCRRPFCLLSENK